MTEPQPQPQHTEFNSHTHTLILDSENLVKELPNLKRTDTGLVAGIALFGSTNVDWRSGHVIDTLTQDGIPNYNPYVDTGWDESFIDSESIAMDQMSVLGLRIESGELDGSLGSLTEIGMAVAFALINGQELVISIDKEYYNSLEDSAAKAQYIAIINHLKKIIESEPDSGITLLLDSTREEFVQAAKTSYEKQNNPEIARKPITKEYLEEFAEKRRKRLENGNWTVCIGGSSGPAVNDDESRRQLKDEQERLHTPWLSKVNENVCLSMVLYELFGDEWDRAYQQIGKNQREIILKLLETEYLLKDAADVLVWTIHSMSSSPVASIEAGLFIRDAIASGKLLNFMIDKFNKVDEVLREKLKKEEPQLRQTFAGNQEVIRILDDLDDHPESINLARIKKSPLKGTAAFRKAANDKRVRAIAQRHLSTLNQKVKRISEDAAIELLIMTESPAQMEKAVQLVISPEKFAAREQYFQNFEKVKASLEEIIEDIKAKEKIKGNNEDEKLKSNAEGFVRALVTAVSNVFESEMGGNLEAVEPLFKHMGDVGETTHLLADYLRTLSSKEIYLTDQELTILKFAAPPIHDLMKLVGKPEVQISTDHEDMVKYMVEKYSSKFDFSQEMTTFLAGVVGNHENIFDEDEFANGVDSQNHIRRAQALFLIADTLSGTVTIEGEPPEIKLIEEKLWDRFGDLYYRHMDVVKGKIWRPMWGVKTIKDIIHTLEVLEQSYGANVDPKIKDQLIAVGLEAIDKAISSKNNAEITGRQRQELLDAKNELEIYSK